MFASVMFLVATPAMPASAQDESQIITVLQSPSASLAEKDAACARLKRIGTARSVPAMQALLAETNLSHSARYALESMPFPEAGTALLAELEKTDGLTRMGLIHSLGIRGETIAVPALGKLVLDPDVDTVRAAAVALGKLGSSALEPLQTAWGKSSGAVRLAVADGLLSCASALRREGPSEAAQAAFKLICDHAAEPHLRQAAWRGFVGASHPSRWGELLVDGISGKDMAVQNASLELCRVLPGKLGPDAVARALPQIDAGLQPAVIRNLAQGGHKEALVTITGLLGSQSAEVRLAAIQAIGFLGSATSIPVLAKTAASTTGPEQAAARQALVDLHGLPPTDSLVELLQNADPAIQAESARALGLRGHHGAVKPLIELARKAPAGPQETACAALGQIASDSDLPALVGLVIEAKADALRNHAARAVQSASQRLLAIRGSVITDTLVQAIRQGPPAAKIALLPVASGSASPDVAAALREAAHDSDPAVSAAAFQALCDSVDVALVPDLLEAAARRAELRDRSAAVRACVRLVGPEHAGQNSLDRRLEVFTQLLKLPLRPEEKRVVLSGLAELPILDALRVVLPMVAEKEVQAEAAGAASRIATSLSAGDAPTALPILQQVIDSVTTDAARKPLEAALQKLNEQTKPKL